MPGLVLHATERLASKLGGFTDGPIREADPSLVFTTWYANILRQRSPRIIAIHPATYLTVTLPLAPATTATSRLPGAIAAALVAFGAPPDFIEEQVAPLLGGATVARTADRSVLGVLNRRIMEARYFETHTDADWRDTEAWFLRDWARAGSADAVRAGNADAVRAQDLLDEVIERWEKDNSL